MEHEPDEVRIARHVLIRAAWARAAGELAEAEEQVDYAVVVLGGAEAEVVTPRG